MNNIPQVLRDEAYAGLITGREGPESYEQGYLRLEAENGRLREAIEHIAQGNISPAIKFARRILAGDSVDAAHKAQVAIWDQGCSVL